MELVEWVEVDSMEVVSIRVQKVSMASLGGIWSDRKVRQAVLANVRRRHDTQIGQQCIESCKFSHQVQCSCKNREQLCLLRNRMTLPSS